MKEKGRILYKKIRYAKERVFLEWTEKIDGEYIGGYIESYQEPMDTFKSSLTALAQDCIEICELGEIELSRVEVHTVNIKYETEKEIPGIIISFKINREKRSGSIGINTPYHLLKARKEGNDEQVLEGDTAEKVYALIQEADYYRTGKKKQIDFNFEPDEPADDDYIVKLNPEQKGLIKSGVLITLNKLVNDPTICTSNGKSGIYHLNPNNKQIINDDKKKVDAFTFKRLDRVMILESIMDIKIDEYEGEHANVIAIDLLQEYFLNATAN